MMEHEIPEKPLIKFLYYVRLTTMGSRKNRGFASDERTELRSYFSDVIKIPSPTGRSKLLSAKKEKAGARSPQ
jgi:demethylmenaquinone methyltransferase/2-methoxy-6-polyprenyl-1,4-benzoquinol methylase